MGGLSQVSGPTLDVVSLAEARKHLKVDVTDDDGLIAGYIFAARAFCEMHTGRAILNQVFDLTIDDDWPPQYSRPPYWPPIAAAWPGCSSRRITIPLAPLVSVASITYTDTAGAPQTLASDQYRVITRSATVRGWIEPAYGVAWPAVRMQSEAITVRFTAGYGDQPGGTKELELFRQAMLLLIGSWYANKEAVVVGSPPAELPLGVDALLRPLVIDGLL